MTTDVLVIGTGISGLSYAIKLASFSSKLKILLICKKDIMEGNTRYAQGGIAVVSNFQNDSFEKHINYSSDYHAIPDEGWNGKNKYNENLSNGTYFYHLYIEDNNKNILHNKIYNLTIIK